MLNINSNRVIPGMIKINLSSMLNNGTQIDLLSAEIFKQGLKPA
jgi:hypothetical protein